MGDTGPGVDWRGREDDVTLFNSLFGPFAGAFPILLVYGPPGEGKSLFVLDHLRKLSVETVLVDGAVLTSDRQVFGTIVRQLAAFRALGNTSHRLATVAASRRAAMANQLEASLICDSAADFVSTLVGELHGREPPVIVVDSADTAAERCPTAIDTLLRISDLARVDVGVVLIATSAMEHRIAPHADRVHKIAFSPLLDEDAREVVQSAPPPGADPALYRAVSGRVCDAVSAQCPGLRDQLSLAHDAYAACAGAATAERAAALDPSSSIDRAPMAWTDALRRDALGRLNATLPHLAETMLAPAALPTPQSDGGGGRTLPRRVPAHAALPTQAQVAIVAGFLCSRLPASGDAALFSGSHRGKRRRRARSAAGGAGQVFGGAHLEAPKPFTLQRASDVFLALLAEHDTARSAREAASSGLFGSVAATLCDTGVFAVPTVAASAARSEGSGLSLGAPRLLCTAPMEDVEQMAAALKIPLHKYLGSADGTDGR